MKMYGLCIAWRTELQYKAVFCWVLLKQKENKSFNANFKKTAMLLFAIRVAIIAFSICFKRYPLYEGFFSCYQLLILFLF